MPFLLTHSLRLQCPHTLFLQELVFEHTLAGTAMTGLHASRQL